MLAHLLFTSFSASLIVEVFACKPLGACSGQAGCPGSLLIVQDDRVYVSNRLRDGIKS